VVLAAGLSACGGGDEPRSAQAAVDAWVAALNARDWERACELEEAPPRDCPQRKDRSFTEHAGRLRSAGRHQQGESLIYSVEMPGASVGVAAREVDGEWRVHPEVQIIR
jgi:hypothetical protein